MCVSNSLEQGIADSPDSLPLGALTDEQVDAILDQLYAVDEWPPLDCEDEQY